MQEIHDWRLCEVLMKDYDMKYTVYSERIKVENKRGIILGSFVNASELVNYLHGYGSGLLDCHLYLEAGEEDE